MQVTEFLNENPQSMGSDLLAELQGHTHFYNKVVHQLPAAVYACNAEGYVTFYNDAAAKLWGRKPEIGRDLWCGSWKIFDSDGVTPVELSECPMAVTLREGKPVRGVEVIVECPDGTRRNVAPHPDPLFDEAGKMLGAVNLLVDITPLKQKENALRESETRYRQMAEELEIRVAERTEELSIANMALQRSNAELEQFALAASHDMQEPLRKIITYCKLVEQEADADNGNAQAYIEKIMRSSERMGTLIKDILNYSRLIHIDEQFVPTNLNVVLKRVLEDLELGLQQREAVLKIDDLPTVRAIPVHMVQLFFNLIGNSLKFCKPAVPCELIITASTLHLEDATKLGLSDDHSYCEIIVTDNGIGFDQEFAANIFKIFNRLNARDKYEGTGIGLALCEKVVSVHSGVIFAVSAENMGTSMHVVLPLAG